MGSRLGVVAGLGLLLAACTEPLPQEPQDPSDDPLDHEVATSIDWKVEASAPDFWVPESLPAGITELPSNNNLDVELFQGRWWLAWRTASLHWATADARMHIASSGDRGKSWRLEHTVQLGTDLREPRLLVFGGRLSLHFFQAGTNPFAFEPKRLLRVSRAIDGSWSEPEEWGPAGKVPWNLKVRGGRAWLTSYLGNHYSDAPESNVDLFFEFSEDGRTWQPTKGERGVVHHGGSSEAAFEFTADGSLWAVLRNEDGDEAGFGSQVCTAPAENLGEWSCSARCDPERYDSPEMFRHGNDIFLVARRDVGGPFDQGRSDLTLAQQRDEYALTYWRRPKRTALYRIDQTAKRVVHVMDLPGSGDTAFPAIRRLDAHHFLVANYTSPLNDPDRSWFDGQSSPQGTHIYGLVLTFSPAD